MFEAEVEIGVDDGRAFDGAVGVGVGIGEIEEPDFGEREILGGGVDAKESASVVRAAAGEDAPIEGGGNAGGGEVPAGDVGRRRAVLCLPLRARWGSAARMESWSAVTCMVLEGSSVLSLRTRVNASGTLSVRWESASLRSRPAKC